jgi:hypothetical protein
MEIISVRGKEKEVDWPMSASEAARVCGISDDNWGDFHFRVNNQVRPELRKMGVLKSGSRPQDHYIVEKKHAQKMAMKLGLRYPS